MGDIPGTDAGESVQEYHYLDTSVVLAHILEDSPHLKDLEGNEFVSSSRILWTEVSRGLHRALLSQRLSPAEATEARHVFARLATGMSRIRLTEAVLQRAEGPYPLVIRTLDAIHLASAELWLRTIDGEVPLSALHVWTLDQRMNHCAAQLGFSTPLLASAL